MSAPFSCTVTLLKDFAARTKRQINLTPEEIAGRIRTTHGPTKAALPLLFPGILGDKPIEETGCLRHDGNTDCLTIIAVDYDGEQISFDEVLAILIGARLYCILYTSPSHHPLRPRWRILAFASRGVPPSEHTPLVARLSGLLRGVIDGGSFTLSRSYFYGYVGDGAHHRVEIVPGDYIDLRDDLDAGAIGKPNGMDPRMPGAFSSRLDEKRAVKGIITGESIYRGLLSLAGKWAHEGVPWLETRQRFWNLFDSIPPEERPDRWQKRRDEIPRILAYVYGKEIERRSEEPEFTIHGNSTSARAPGAESPAGDAPGAVPGAETEPEPAVLASLSLQQLRDAEFGEPDFLMGELVSTTSRIEVIGPTGIGKSNLVLAMSMAIAAGEGFLHWQARRASKVLYIDGEMSPRLLKARAIDTIRRAGGLLPSSLFFLSQALCEEMQPLNHPAGQRFVDQQIELLGGVDLLVIDNVQSLLTGDMKDEMPWQQTLPWVRDLTNRHIGQIWVHHTGHDESHGYGTKTREWQLDTVILMLREDTGAADIKFRIECTKARERTPLNRTDFDPRVITLDGDVWTSELGESGGSGGRRPTAKDRAIELLADAISRYGEYPEPDKDGLPPFGFGCVPERAWRQRCAEGNISEANEEAQRKAFARAAKALIQEGRVGKHREWVWVIRR